MSADPLLAFEVGSGLNATECSGSMECIEPSTALCIGLSAFGGFLEVTSTMCLAYPEYRIKMGHEYSKCFKGAMMVLNLLLMGVASVAYIVGSWFGPVSLSVPVVMISKLLFNMVIMGVVLRMTNFSKDQQVGTYCIACAILTLPEVGPSDQPGLDVIELVKAPAALVWIAILTAATISCCIGMCVLASRAKKAAALAAAQARAHTSSTEPAKADAAATGVVVAAPPPASECVSLIVYTMAQVVSAVLSTSISKMFPRVEGVVFICLLLVRMEPKHGATAHPLAAAEAAAALPERKQCGAPGETRLSRLLAPSRSLFTPSLARASPASAPPSAAAHAALDSRPPRSSRASSRSSTSSLSSSPRRPSTRRFSCQRR